MNERYFVDERVGMVAIRDRFHPEYDKERSGLNSQMPDVFISWAGTQVSVICKECGHTKYKEWRVDPAVVKIAENMCAELNGKDPK